MVYYISKADKATRKVMEKWWIKAEQIELMELDQKFSVMTETNDWSLTEQYDQLH